MTKRIYWDNYTDKIIEYWNKEEEKTKKRFSIINNWLESVEYQSLLDIGCGNGNLIRYCKIPTNKYLGIDYSEEMLKILRKDFPEYNTMLLDFISNNSLSKVDTVVATGFLEHQPGLYSSINKIKKLAKKEFIIDLIVDKENTLVFTNKGYWSHKIDKRGFSTLKDNLNKDYIIEENNINNRYLIFCRRR